MNLKFVTNSNLRDMDWAGDERRAALKKMGRMKVQPSVSLVCGVPARSVWMSDVSGADRRSVKASLAGRGDLRVFWWNVKQVGRRVLGLGAVEVADGADGVDKRRQADSGLVRITAGMRSGMSALVPRGGNIEYADS